MQMAQKVDIFWDFETTPLQSDISGFQIARRLREIANSYGLVRSFRTYLDVTKQQNPNFSKLKRELYSSGISIIDCPGTSRKDVVDKTMIVDMLTLAMDESPPSTILVATGDQDISYALAILRLRRFKVILVYPTGIHECLVMQSDQSTNWDSEVLGRDTDREEHRGRSSSSSSSSPSRRSVGSYISYASAPPVNGLQSSVAPRAPMGGYSKSLNTSISQAKIPRHHRTRSSARSSIIDELSPFNSPSHSPSPSRPQSPRSPKSLSGNHDSIPTSLTQAHGADNLKPRARSSTISGGFFFPPPPTFPLDPPPRDTMTLAPKTEPEASATSTPSSSGFAIIDRPKSTPEHQPDDTRSPQPDKASSSPVPNSPNPFNRSHQTTSVIVPSAAPTLLSTHLS
ncbi:hypothetical protein NP233_g3050 [Leucocoprinus birnbaumii]|uniref:NYN domain-containing protein n=1 Tax=Leucocoprinus birnbaumii TaxID=56174 RepID=A0AAD5VXS7_9AGAR|nr:hypothetical protein NP233_g3050 [Leucocoprinus birnbaumii]